MQAQVGCSLCTSYHVAGHKWLVLTSLNIALNQIGPGDQGIVNLKDMVLFIHQVWGQEYLVLWDGWILGTQATMLSIIISKG